MSTIEYYYLKEGEIIQPGDEVDVSNGWHDEPKWEVTNCAGEKAPDPSYPSHRIYRRRLEK